MKTLFRHTFTLFFLSVLLSTSASCRENEVQFGFNEIRDVKGQKILVFYLNPSDWMFGVSGAWAVDSAGEKVTWGNDTYALEGDFGEGWSPLKPKYDSANYRRIQLYYFCERRFDATVAFSASRLSDEILMACDQRGLDSCRVRIKYKLPTKLISANHSGFESGPILESDWILVEVRKRIVYLVGYWDPEGFRGYLSTAGRNNDHESNVNPPVVLNEPSKTGQAAESK